MSISTARNFPISQDIRELDRRAGQILVGSKASSGAAGLSLIAAGALAIASSMAAPVATLEQLDVLSAVAVALPEMGGLPFESLTDSLLTLLTGPLSKMMAIAAFIIGMGLGLVRQSVSAVVMGIAMAMTVSYGPHVIVRVLDPGHAEAGKTVDPVTLVQQTKDARERAYYEAQMAAQAGDGAATRTALTKLGLASEAEAIERDKPADGDIMANAKPQTLYAVEMAAFGEPRSEAATRYAAEAQSVAAGRWSGALAAFNIAGLAGATAFALFTLGRRMKRRVTRLMGVAHA